VRLVLSLKSKVLGLGLTHYFVYMYVNLEKQNHQQSASGHVIRNEGSMEPYSQIVSEIRRSLPMLDGNYVKILLENCEIEKNLRTKLFNFLDSTQPYARSIRELDTIRESITHGRSERALVMEAFENFKRFKRIKIFLPDLDIVY